MDAGAGMDFLPVAFSWHGGHLFLRTSQGGEGLSIIGGCSSPDETPACKMGAKPCSPDGYY